MYREYTQQFTCTCTPVNCVWGPWSGWTACYYDANFVSSPRNGYVQYRSRTVTQQGNFCGTPCVGAGLDWQACADPNGYPAAASPLAVGGNGGVDSASWADWDWWRFSAPASSTYYYVRLTFTDSATSDLQLALYRNCPANAGCANQVFVATNTGDNEIMYYRPTQNEEVYLHVYSTTSTQTTSYRINVDTNGHPGGAESLLGTTTATASSYDTDWYKFSASVARPTVL